MNTFDKKYKELIRKVRNAALKSTRKMKKNEIWVHSTALNGDILEQNTEVTAKTIQEKGWIK